jgi:hypothetical protein
MVTPAARQVVRKDDWRRRVFCILSKALVMRSKPLSQRGL